VRRQSPYSPTSVGRPEDRRANADEYASAAERGRDPNAAIFPRKARRPERRS
jgi:hypothetical protein